MSINSKFLSESAWKDLLSKNKALKDIGLQKMLAQCKKVDEDDHDELQKILAEVMKLSGQLKKSKEIAALPVVGKYLNEVLGAAESATRDVTKSKAEAEKKSKAAAESKKREQGEQKSKKDDDDEGDEGESPELLTTKLLPLLRQVNKGETMHALVASSGKQVVAMLSRKPIAPARRKVLADYLGASGGVKYFVGHCVREQGTTTFVLKTQAAGLTKKLKLALLEQTGLRLKLRCRGEDGETDEDEDDATASYDDDSTHDDKEHEATDDGDDSGKYGDEPPEFVPGVDVEPASPALANAPQVWEGTRELLRTNIDALKKAVQVQIADEGYELIDEIEAHLQKHDRIVGKLDRRLADCLAKAGAAVDASARTAELGNAKAILADYIRYVRAEPLIEHLDSNPFGVKTNLKSTLSTSLTQLARAIG